MNWQRDEFEAWLGMGADAFHPKAFSFDDKKQKYICRDVQYAWAAWQHQSQQKEELLAVIRSAYESEDYVTTRYTLHLAIRKADKLKKSGAQP